MNIADDVRSWVEAPFRERLDIVHVFLLTGLVMVFVVLWSRILVHLAE